MNASGLSLLIAIVMSLFEGIAGTVAVDAQPGAFDQLLGIDDGPALAILFGGNLRGNLEMCDCTHPRGGLARRVGYVEGFKKKFKQTAVIQVEAGNFLDATLDYRGQMPSLAALQNKLVLGAYDRWPVDVINLGRQDLIYAQQAFAADGLNERLRFLPILKNVITANGLFSGRAAAPPGMLIKEISGARIKQKKLRAGFVGLAEPMQVSEGRDATVSDMFEAARRTVLTARKQADLVVIVAHCEVETAVRLARENPEVDIVIAGNAETVFKPRTVGNTFIVCAAPGNTQEGDLRIYIGPGGKYRFTFRSTDLDNQVPADPAAIEYTKAVREELLKNGTTR